MIKYFLILHLLCFHLQAQDQSYQQAFREDISDEDLDDARFNFKTGLFETDYLSAQNTRLSFSYHGLADIRNFTDFTGLEFIFAKKGSYSWFEFLIAKSSGNFGVLTEFNPALGAKPSDIDQVSESLISLGPGLSYRSTLIQNFSSSTKISESTAVYLLYHSLTEDYFSHSYKGIGLRTDFALNYSLSKMTQFGFKFSYNIAPLKREAQTDQESSSTRSLLLSYMSLGFELSYFF